MHVDGPREKTAPLLPKGIGAVGERPSGIAEEKNVDPLGARNLTESCNYVEGAVRIDIEQNE